MTGQAAEPKTLDRTKRLSQTIGRPTVVLTGTGAILAAVLTYVLEAQKQRQLESPYVTERRFVAESLRVNELRRDIKVILRLTCKQHAEDSACQP